MSDLVAWKDQLYAWAKAERRRKGWDDEPAVDSPTIETVVEVARRLVDEVRYFDDHPPEVCVLVRTANQLSGLLDNFDPEQETTRIRDAVVAAWRQNIAAGVSLGHLLDVLEGRSDWSEDSDDE